MKKILLFILIGQLIHLPTFAQWVRQDHAGNAVPLSVFEIVADSNDHPAVLTAARLLQQDIEAVTGNRLPIVHTATGNPHCILIGSISGSPVIQRFLTTAQLGVKHIKDTWEAGWIHTVTSSGSTTVLVTGADGRGTAYAALELSRQLGVSPWYWWADVPITKQKNLYVQPGFDYHDAPLVKYRGIFINDEAPALSGWVREKMGGFNHLFYEKVFELLLRLKANYIWPAMWGNAFYDDDTENIRVAREYGIVIGTSHHEPMMRAHDEWRRYHLGQPWNYDLSRDTLRRFWREGLQRARNEKIVTVGMRGDGDEPMSKETATALLEKIVQDQRQIIEEVTAQPATHTPQLWALYKEVQDYYDKGMRVPDDVTLLLCDDNWGNIRRLPMLHEKPRKGGYGIYYHFDYVGGPRNYKWINTNPLPRIWEQMHLAWQYNARQIWIVNVGDIKPMEFPISFFLDYAWNPQRIGPTDLQSYTEQWCASQWGSRQAAAIASLLSSYAKYNARRKPELLDQNTYNLRNYNEWETVVNEYQTLRTKAAAIRQQLDTIYRNAYFQLIEHPILAMSNLYELYYYTALNHDAWQRKDSAANKYARLAEAAYRTDSLITLQYHQLNGGKWNHFMSQTHIGYTNWQQPEKNKIPELKWLDPVDARAQPPLIDSAISFYKSSLPAKKNNPVFYEYDRVVSIEAAHYSRAVNKKEFTWQVLPDHGRTGDAVTLFPVTVIPPTPGKKAPCLEYEFYTVGSGPVSLQVSFSPTLNFQNNPDGLRYAIAIDKEAPQIISINAADKTSISGVWNTWVAENIIHTSSAHQLQKPGKHVIRFWVIDPGIVLQKLVVDLGGLKQSYLGPPETEGKR